MRKDPIDSSGVGLDKTTALRLATMVESGLISYRYLHPWADARLLEKPLPPAWLCDVSTEKYSPRLVKILREYAFSEPFSDLDTREIGNEYLACFYLRYERRELSWASFLQLAGEHSDPGGGDLDCEYFYEMLNELEDSEYDPGTEEHQARQFLERHKPHFGAIRSIYAALHAWRFPSHEAKG